MGDRRQLVFPQDLTREPHAKAFGHTLSILVTCLKLLSHRTIVRSMPRPGSTLKKGQIMSSTDELQTYNASPKWQERFAFFDQHGGPKSPDFKQAFKQLPARKRLLINLNFIAFFFGPIYFFVLGLWKKNLAIIAIIVAISIALTVVFALLGYEEAPKAFNSGMNVVFALMYGLSANYAYYLKQVKGSQGWNPFEGLRMT
jgi:hypothetical protein